MPSKTKRAQPFFFVGVRICIISALMAHDRFTRALLVAVAGPLLAFAANACMGWAQIDQKGVIAREFVVCAYFWIG